MQKIILTLFILTNHLMIGQWINTNSGLTDNLTDIVVFGSSGLASGHNGLYYTLTEGEENSSWQKFEIPDSDNEFYKNSYKNTIFKSCYTNPGNTEDDFSVFAVGQDTESENAVIMEIKLPSLEYKMVKINIENSDLVDIDYSATFGGNYYAVGNNGLMVYFQDDINDYSIVNNSIESDLTVIKFSSTGSRARIGGINEFHSMWTSGHSINTFQTPNVTHKDLLYGTYRMYSVNENYLSFNYSNKTIYTNYDYGILNGNAIKYYGGFHFIATDHGIFKSNLDNTILEWQPSSLDYNINSFWKTYGVNKMYACGSDGVILKNEIETLLEEAKPYVEIEFDGGCISSYSKNIKATIGSSSSCNWYINNTFVSSDCDGFNYDFDSTGEFEIKLIVDFNELTTEATKTIHIVNPPLIDKPISILDSILCKEEVVEITIDNSELNVQYVLRKENSDVNYGTSEVGNGETVILTSELINETGIFYIEAQNIQANSCSRSFTETFEIVVEQTKANFYVDLINASVNENIYIHNLSEEAESFRWNFENANIELSTEENPNVSFETTGVHEINLKATSANDCNDDITLNSPNIYQEPSEDQECWSYINTIEHPSYTGSYIPEISHITKVNDGYLTGGYYRNSSFASNHGVPLNVNNNEGAYLTKHDYKGVLKWWVHSQSTIDFFRERSLTTASVQDHEGNIYLALNTINCDFYDNSGKEFTNLSGGKIIKLNSRGELIWHMIIRTFTPTGLKVDNNNDLLIFGSYDSYNDYNHTVHVNDNEVGLVGLVNESVKNIRRVPDHSYGIIKAKKDGSILWDNKIYSDAGALVDNFEIDENNNYYIEGNYQSDMYIFHTGDTEYTHLARHQYQAGGTSYAHLFKLNANGELQWTTRSYSTNDEGEYGGVSTYDSATDKDGNTYLTGYANSYGTTNKINNTENSDGTIFQSQETNSYFLKKINSAGICEWVIGVDEANNTSNARTTGFRITITEDKLKILGTVNAYLDELTDVTFKSTNDTSLKIPLHKDNIFISSYSFDGVINDVFTFEDNADRSSYTTTSYYGFITNENGYYISSNVEVSNGITNGRINYYNDSCAEKYRAQETLSSNEYILEELQLYPNPTNDNITLKTNKIVSSLEVKVYDTIGQLIFHNEFKDTDEVSIEIPGEYGLYVIELILDGKEKTIKKIIKR